MTTLSLEDTARIWHNDSVKRSSSFLLALFSALAISRAAAEDEAYEFDRWCVGAGGGVVLPGNGNALKCAAAVSVRGGYYLSETFAVEAEGFSAPNAAAKGRGTAAVQGVTIGGLAHFTSFTFYDRLFGSERFDPFLTFGVQSFFASKHVFADCSHRTAVGPYAGIGAFYHLTDNLSLRADARAALCCDSPCGMMYGVQLGLQYSFGADE